jgi:hypothetical protein
MDEGDEKQDIIALYCTDFLKTTLIIAVVQGVYRRLFACRRLTLKHQAVEKRKKAC